MDGASALVWFAFSMWCNSSAPGLLRRFGTASFKIKELCLLMMTVRCGLLAKFRIPILAFLLPLAAGCAQLAPPQGCASNEPGPQVVAPTQSDEQSCMRFSIDATQEPATMGAPIVLPGFPLDPADQYRLTVESVSVPWSDGPAPATPEGGWTGWRSVLGKVAHYQAICPRAQMYQAVCAPSGAMDHCAPADGQVFRPDRIGAATCFANDWSGHYGNNSGCVAVRLCKLTR
jgi:hypothetical protein